jgi:hypothetical protein
MPAGLDHERAVLGEDAFAANERLLDEGGRAEIPMDVAGVSMP